MLPSPKGSWDAEDTGVKTERLGYGRRDHHLLEDS